MCDVDADKPFICSAPGCGMRFTNEDHLNVHLKKHEMSLAVHGGGPSGSSGPHLADQTPTPTKFLKNCEEISLFQELTKNPFEEAFKKASDTDDLPPLPGPQVKELNTPVLPSSGSDRLPGGVFDIHAGGTTTTTTTHPSFSSTTAPSSHTFVLDLSGQTAREANLMLPSGQRAREANLALPSSSSSCSSTYGSEGEEGRMSMSMTESSLSSSKSLPSVIPLVSATEVMMGGQGELSFAGRISASSDQGLMSASAAAPHPTMGATPTLMTSAHPHTSASPPSASSQTSPACSMQVYLQLPTGHTVPVHLPPTVSGTPPPEAATSPQQQLPQQVAATLPTQTHTAELGVHQPPVLSTLQSPGGSSVTLKQRLKQTLQQSQTQPASTLSPASGASSEGEVHLSGLSTPVSTSTQLLLSSPSSSFNLADLEPVSKRPKNGSIDTDDPVERRQKFLERNRAAAARCRHKRKQWIVNLEKKAEELQQTNSKLQGEVGLLKGEVAQLKTLLLAHQNCPITMHQQSQGQLALQTISMLESSSSVPLDIGQLLSPGGTTSTLTPVDSQEVGAIDPAAFALSTAAEK
ncbi:cyclic AMP-dependent transcription factor ATF-7-like [Babylonia areolata]|uniref:cyclic AMP-dependent transcription factor ATF-7-like n=1 Tax=Babylonia areolata TaxID=304850 RepID=UPI003FCF65B9